MVKSKYHRRLFIRVVRQILLVNLILFESAKKYLQEHLGESKTLNISKWKAEIGTLRKEKDSLYSQIKDIRKEVEQAESVRGCIDKLLQEKRGLTQVKKKALEV